MASKIDQISADIGEIKIVQAEQHIILKDHIKRTEILEKAIVPMGRHLIFWSMCGKIMTWVGGAIAAAAAIVEIVKFFGHG